jgi:hypothetical protein
MFDGQAMYRLSCSRRRRIIFANHDLRDGLERSDAERGARGSFDVVVDTP